MSSNNDKAQIYKRIKILGLLTFIPVVLAAGPLAGLFLGEFLEKHVGFAPYISLFCVAIGFIAGAREVIRIIKLIYRTDRRA